MHIAVTYIVYKNVYRYLHGDALYNLYLTKSLFRMPELQIRKGSGDKRKIFFLFLNETYVVTLH